MSTRRPTKPADSSNRRSRWLCIAYAFPPTNRSGTHRTLGFVRELDRLGWDATIITAQPAAADPLDQNLVDLVPRRAKSVAVEWCDIVDRIKRTVGRGHTTAADEVVSTADTSDGTNEGYTPQWNRVRYALRRLISQCLQTPDSRLGWVYPGVRSAMAQVRRTRPDVLYSTSPYVSAHLIAMIVSVRTRIPWVADFRDPWRGNPFRKLGSRSLDAWDALFEYAVLRTARHVICNTPTMRSALVARRAFVGRKCSVILNGFDPRRTPNEPVSSFDTPPDETVLLHCGQFYGPRRPHVWFDALRRAIETDPRGTHGVTLELLGPPNYHGEPLTEIARKCGVAQRVRVVGPRPHGEVLERLKRAHVLLLAGAEGTGLELQVPNKLFEYLAARRPVIANFPKRSPVLDILRDSDARAVICGTSHVSGLAWAMLRLVGAGVGDAPAGVEELCGTWKRVERYARAPRARELAEIFSRLSGRHCIREAKEAAASVIPPTPQRASAAVATPIHRAT